MIFVYRKSDHHVARTLEIIYGSETPKKKLFIDLPEQAAKHGIWQTNSRRYETSECFVISRDGEDHLIVVTVKLPIDGQTYCFLANPDSVTDDYETSVIDHMMYEVPSGELVKFEYDPTVHNSVECKCGEAGVEGATCPFSEEIHQKERICGCCRDCQHQCAMDI